MSIQDINNNPRLLKMWVDSEKTIEEQYYAEHPGSLILCFDKELRDLGFEFEIGSQAIGFMPKHKKEILPIAIKYYQLAKSQQKDNEQNYFMKFFRFRGFEEIVPMLLEDYYSETTQSLTRWFISDCLYQIRSNNYISEYVKIAENSDFGINRQMIILLLGKLKAENAVQVLVELLEDEEVRLQTIDALGNFKREEFRCYFEQFRDSRHPGWRKCARAALKKLDG